MALKLYGEQNKNVHKGLITAQYAGVKVELVTADMGVTNKTPEFLAMNPHGKVPLLSTPSGAIFESNSIARYIARLADKGLFGSTPFEAAQVEQWIDFSTGEVDVHVLNWYIPYIGYGPYDKKKEEVCKVRLQAALATLDKHLESRTFLVRETITLADIIMACNLSIGFQKLFDAETRTQFPNATRFYLTMAHQPQFRVVCPAYKEFSSEPLVLPVPTKAEKPAKEAKPAAAPKAAKPAKDDDDEDKPAGADEEKAAKLKVDAWLASLAPTPMQLDGWKRLYSNSPAATFREVAIGGLWNGGKVPNSQSEEVFPGYDASGYSMWFCNYKYPDENTVNFIVMNKVGGFLQRIDYARKYAFGVMSILKDGPQFPIKGAWIFRGPDLPPQMLDECYDMELYDWIKVDVSDAAQKKRFEDILCEEATIDGLENIQAKVFK